MTTSTHRRIPSTGGITLEVLIESPDPANARDETILICHPHPTQGGTMTHPILGAIAKTLTSTGFTAVRFNFRGVGDSTGTHDDGVGELSDVASVAGLIDHELPSMSGITGWSFGAAMALLWQAKFHSTIAYVGIAPPVESALTPDLPVPEDLASADRLFIVGERDQFVDVPKLNAYAHTIDADISIYRGSDHFFVFKHQRLADDVAAFLTSAR